MFKLNAFKSNWYLDEIKATAENQDEVSLVTRAIKLSAFIGIFIGHESMRIKAALERLSEESNLKVLGRNRCYSLYCSPGRNAGRMKLERCSQVRR